MSIFDDVLGLGRTGYVNESVEPELENDDFDSVESLNEAIDSMDFMLEAMFNNEMNMERIDKAIMCEEYTYLRENGEEMVYEAGKIESIIQSAKRTVLRLWGQIQKFLKTQSDRIVTKMDTAFLKKYESKAKGKSGYVKGSDYYMEPKERAQAAIGLIKKFEDIAIKVADKAFAETDAEFLEWDTVAKQYNVDTEFLKTGRYERKQNMTEKTFSADKAITAFKEVLSAKNDIKAVYNASKKTVNGQLKALKKMENSLKKFKVIPTEASSNVHKAVRTVTKIGSQMAIVCRIYCKELNTSKAMCKAIIISAAAKDRPEVKREGVEFNSSFVDNVEFL